VIYAIAMRFSLSTEEAEQHIEASRREAEIEEQTLETA
jgi:hypothetical protein